MRPQVAASATMAAKASRRCSRSALWASPWWRLSPPARGSSHRFNYAVFIPGVVASGALTIAATMLAPSVPTRAGLLVILGLAVLMRLLIITDDPFLSTDIYRYVWDGRVQAAGMNPYALVPADPTLAALRDAAIYPNINRADYAVTAYPPVAQMFFLAVTRISETLTMMRLAMVACETVVIAVLIDLLRQLRMPATAVVAWAWHPWRSGRSPKAATSMR